METLYIEKLNQKDLILGKILNESFDKRKLLIEIYSDLNLTDHENKLCEILSKEDFSYVDIYESLGVEFSLYCMQIDNEYNKLRLRKNEKLKRNIK